jgi:lipopolysaccharide biosynthesis protein
MSLTFKEANLMLREKKYIEAVEIYKKIIHERPFIKKYIEFNINLIARKNINIDLNINLYESNEIVINSTLEKPSNLDESIFQRIKESGLFDIKWYLQKYTNKFGIIKNPLEHYLENEIIENLCPSNSFDTEYYLRSNPDVRKACVSPLIHYINQGKLENRSPLKRNYENYCTNNIIKTNLQEKKYIKKNAKVIAFYLPQFHEIPENNKWWGEGFTEWKNVKPAKPLFENHYQPHMPGELGYYDLSDINIQQKQIKLAKSHGVEGFSFYFYWFKGKTLLEKPLANYLDNSELDLPFCLCWANENWSRRWDGKDSEILIEQGHSSIDDLNFIKYISKYLKDSRYIKFNGKPLIIVYRPSLLPEPRKTAEIWRKWCEDNGIGEIFIAYTQSFESADPKEFGFDAAIEFPPNNTSPPNITDSINLFDNESNPSIYDWRELPERSKKYVKPEYLIFRGVNPSWDNTARRKKNATILLNSSPALYQEWLVNAIKDTKNRLPEHDNQLVFVNAWNEWAEGAHLEPDEKYGYAYLEATRVAHARTCTTLVSNINKLGVVIHAFYPDVYAEILGRLKTLQNSDICLFITTTEDSYDEILSITKGIFNNFQIFKVVNRGRDILPFLTISDELYKNNIEYILKLHTKKSRHRRDGEIWRNDIFDKLININTMDAAIDAFNNQTSVGLIGPADHVVPMNYYFGANDVSVNKLALRMGQNSCKIMDCKFIAGSMFYARMSALGPLLSLAIDFEEFEVENGQIDGTLAHAIERAFAISCIASNFEIIDTNFDSIASKKNNINYTFA